MPDKKDLYLVTVGGFVLGILGGIGLKFLFKDQNPTATMLTTSLIFGLYTTEGRVYGLAGAALMFFGEAVGIGLLISLQRWNPWISTLTIFLFTLILVKGFKWSYHRLLTTPS